MSRVDSTDETVIGITTQVPDLFTRLGKIKGEYCIQLLEEVQVVPYSLQIPRCVPIPLLLRVKDESERMKTWEVISKIDEPTD